jgi:hypothetical protein
MDGLFPLNQTDVNSDLTKYDWENITKVYLEMFKSLIQESGS